ncbi:MULTISPECIES: efflux RND transporter permease subunit [Spongiibacter]|uniref:efflux RND transporter permease subunit n=2 Tax=Spongiibacteraceae TaxID=1706375 RepID=UPI000C53DABD|nr:MULTISPECIES: efflux RND transporter permease subunit [Spongiibacter]MAY37827.1 multidrug efflux protein [Spongiibacter sp.]|tara:strand:+ start:5251 stop:8328 length:3078 start_codon:yes stop_codon:yes gene_type:complete
MAFTDLFIRRPILSIVVSLLLLLVGGSAMYSLPIREYPAMESATIVITTGYPGATQDVMQGFVTTPIAQAVSTASGIEYLTSTSTQGNSEIKAKLVLNADSDRSMTEILAKVQQVSYRLPEGTLDPVINKITDGASAVQYLAFVSEELPIPIITDFATRVAQPLVTSIPGVASVDFGGAQTLAMRIWVDPNRLAARGMSAGEVAAALRANNIQAAPGQLKDSETVINITAGTDASSIEEFRQLVIKQSDSGLVRLGDVATIELGGQNYDSTFASSGRRAISMAISPTPDGNPLEIVKAVKALIPDLQRSAPPGLEVFSNFDVAHFVNASIDEVTHTLIEAVIIVVLVIFLFLGSFRAVIIPVVTIPLSLIGTAILMLAFGFSLNMLTLLAMVLAIGLVVDDAIVVVENIHRHIEEGLSPVKAALIGAREIVGPVIAMTITLAAVYAPIGLTAGLTGALFKEFAFTLAGSVFVSGIVALTLSPMMSSWLLSDKVHEGRLAKLIEKNVGRLEARYDRVLHHTLSARPAVLAVGAVVLAGIGVLFTGSQRELAPQEDHGYIFTSVKAPQYANTDYTERNTQQIVDIFSSLPEHLNSFMVNGAGGQNNAFGGVVLKEWQERERSSAEIQGELNARVAGLTGVFAAIFPPPPLPAGSGGLPVQMVVRSSDDFSALYQAMEKIKGAAWGSGLFVFVDSDLAFDSAEARVSIDRAKAGELGVTMQAIADTLAILVGENLINRFNWHDRSYDVITQVPAAQRLTPDKLGQYYVKAGSGELIPLSTVIDVSIRPQANRLPQFNQMNSVTLSAVLAPGVTMGQAVTFLQNQQIPPGASIDWLSDSRQYVSEGNRLMVSFVFALIVIFLVLAAQYESFRDPLVILVTVPLAICGALIPLYLGFTTLNIYTQIGLVTLIGLISKHGILMVAFANEIQVHDQVDRATAIRKAARVRMRPILMTTAAMVAGMIPLLFASGAGSASRFAIGIVVVMGMLIGTLFTLFILPTVYSFIAKDHRAASTSSRARELAEGELNHV